MKNFFFFIVSILFFITSCRNTDDEVQRIDQTVHLYIDSMGVDMLNSSNELAYQSLHFNDVYGETENAAVSLISQVDEDAVFFRKYVTGAVRKLIDSTNANSLIYQSKIALKLTFNKNNQEVNVYDTLVLNYKYEPSLFKVDKAFYNDQEIPLEEIDNAYRIKIHK